MKNYNIFALRGDTETNDVDVCTTLGLPLELAGTPAINEAAVNKMHKENYEGYVKNGVDPKKALETADRYRQSALNEIKSLMKDQ